MWYHANANRQNQGQMIKFSIFDSITTINDYVFKMQNAFSFKLPEKKKKTEKMYIHSIFRPMNCAKFKIKTHSHKIMVKNEMRRYHEYLVFICIWWSFWCSTNSSVVENGLPRKQKKKKWQILPNYFPKTRKTLPEHAFLLDVSCLFHRTNNL